MTTRQQRSQKGERSADEQRPAQAKGGELIPGSLASLDTTLPPTPLKKLLAADGASIYVFSADQTLTDAVQEAGGEQYPVHAVAEWTQLLNLVEGGRCKIILLDADRVKKGLEKRIEELNNAGASLVIVVAAPREEAQKLIGMLSQRSIHRLLIKPATVGITRLLLESAVSRYLQLRELAPHELESIFDTPTRRQADAQGTRWPAWVLAVALVSLTLGGVLVGSFMRFGSPPPEAVAPAAADSQASSRIAAERAEPTLAVTSEPVVGEALPLPDSEPRAPAAVSEAAPDPYTELLEQAELAFREGRLASPIGDSALDYYAAILALEPNHLEATQALAGAIDIVFGQAEAALLEGMFDAAAVALENVRRVQPTSSRLAFLDVQLARARDAAEAAAATAAAEPDPEPAIAPAPDREPIVIEVPAGPPNELDSLLAIARTRLDRGQLLAPEGDGARAYLDRAAALSADDNRVLALRSELANAVAGSARLVLEQGDVDGAADLADEAFALGVDGETLAQLDLDLAAAREVRAEAAQRATLDTAREQLRAGRLIDPPQSNALYYLTELRAMNPRFPGAAAAWNELLAAMSATAGDAVAREDFTEAERWIGALASADPDAPAVGALREELIAARRQAAFLAEPAIAGELEVRTAGTVVYPADAVRRGIEGWVDVAYVVGTDGVPKDIRVVAAEPAEWFEEAALASIAQYRYVPYELDGRVYERLMRIRVRFGLR